MLMQNFLDPNVLSALSNLEIQARQVVEGFISGLHKSPFHGFSVEFSQHRPYLPGDGLRYVDWKVFARTDRYYIKQFEQETNLRAQILLDNSNSMRFQSGRLSKYKYASILAASLAYLLIRQKDAVGLALFDERVRRLLPAKSMMSYLPQIYSEIETDQAGNDTNISEVLHEIAEKIHRRSLVILISDLMDEPESVLQGLRHFRHDRHEVIVFQVLDPLELDLEYNGEIVFEDLEDGQKLKTHPSYIKSAYKEQMQKFTDLYRSKCSDNQISYQLIRTDSNFTQAISSFLMKRKRLF